MSAAENIVTIDVATGTVICLLGYWYTGATCVVTVALNGEVDVVAGGESVPDHEDRACATRDALASITAFFMAAR